jgi:ELWxxDGT repeat protein
VTNLGAAGPSSVYALAASSSGVLFVASDSAAGPVRRPALFRTDGTQQGTVQLMSGDDSPWNLSAVVESNGTTFVLDDSGQLVRTDGTPAGTKALTNFNYGAQSIAALPNGRVLVMTNGAGDPGIEFQVVDAAGNATKLSLPTTDAAPAPRRVMGMLGLSLMTLGDKVVIAGEGYPPNAMKVISTLWITDGTDAGTELLRAEDGSTSAIVGTAKQGGSVYLLGNGAELWSTDGTPAGTTRTDLAASLGAAGKLLAVNGLALQGSKLATVSGGDAPSIIVFDPASKTTTRLITQAAPTPFGDDVTATSIGLVFAGGAHLELEPCISDLTDVGTRRIVDLDAAGDTSSDPQPLRLASSFSVAGSNAFFSADDGVHGRELWTTDGTTAGTHLVADLTAGPNGTSFPTDGSFASLGDRFFFTTGGETPKDERLLYVTDGTGAGTKKIATVLPQSATRGIVSTPPPIAQGGNLFFISEAADGHRELYRTDGDPANVTKLADLGAAAGAVMQMIPIGGGVLVYGPSWAKTDAWVSDGTPAGTKSLDIGYADLLATNGLVAYFGKSGATMDLVRVDNAAALPQHVKVAGSQVCRGLAGNDYVFLSSTGELWRSDGSTATLVKTLGGKNQTRGCGTVTSLAYGGKAVFFERSGIIATDGTDAGTQELGKVGRAGAAVSGQGVFFVDADGELSLWDGSVHPLAKNAAAWSLMATPKGILFSTSAGAMVESDGTVAGTRTVAGVPYQPFSMTVLGNGILFAGTAPDGDRELWGADL